MNTKIDIWNQIKNFEIKGQFGCICVDIRNLHVKVKLKNHLTIHADEPVNTLKGVEDFII